MRRIGMALLALTLVATAATAQRRGQYSSGLREVRDRGLVGLTIMGAEPWRDFRRYGDVAAGLTFFGVTGKSLGVRIEGAYLGYGRDYRSYGLHTTSSIGSLAVGPQLTIGSGALRAYGFATLGGSLFWTSVSDDGCGCYDDEVVFLRGDFTTNRSTGVGVLLNVSSRMALDVGVRETLHEEVRYVPAGGISENSDGSFTVDRVQTPVGMRIWHAGISFAIR